MWIPYSRETGLAPLGINTYLRLLVRYRIRSRYLLRLISIPIFGCRVGIALKRSIAYYSSIEPVTGGSGFNQGAGNVTVGGLIWFSI